MQFGDIKKFMESMANISGKNKLYIWGRSVYGNLLGALFNEHQIEWDGYYDNFCDFQEGYLNKKCTFKGEAVDASERAFYVLSMRDYKPVQRQLLEKGVDLEHIICFENGHVLDSIGEAVQGSAVSIEQLKVFHNKHKGEKCFVIGNGPSLTIEDLERIHRSGVISFASNLIFGCYDKTKWRPEYYFFTDGMGIRETFQDRKDIEYVAQNCRYFFSRSNGDLAKWAQEISNLVLFKYVYSESEERFDFSSDCAEKVYTGYTVTYAMLQMAVYMGFEEIYLLGMDHSFSVERRKDGRIIENKNVRNHSEIMEKDRMWGVADMERVEKAYTAAKAYADTHGIKIYNATRGGKLEIFERITFDELF